MASLLLVFLFLWGSCEANGHGRDIHIYAGESGPRCTRGQHCLNGTECVRRRCQCPEGQKGNALIACVREDQHLCEASLDPFLIAYGGSKSRLTLPCRHRLSRFVTDNLAAGKRKHSFCTFEVFGLNQISHEGVFYEAGVEVIIGLADLSKQHIHTVKLKKFGVGYEGLYTYKVNGKTTLTHWGKFVHEVFYGITIYCSFNKVDNFAEIVVPECDTVIKFRPFNFSVDGQVQPLKPGITIQVPWNATFHTQFGGFPGSLCALPEDPRNLFRMITRQRPFNDIAATLTFELLTVAVPQGHEFFKGKYDEECTEASEILSACLNRQRAVNFCNTILSDEATRRCLVKKGKGPMATFNHCLKFKCFSLEEAYEWFKKEINKCKEAPPDLSNA